MTTDQQARVILTLLYRAQALPAEIFQQAPVERLVTLGLAFTSNPGDILKGVIQLTPLGRREMGMPTWIAEV